MGPTALAHEMTGVDAKTVLQIIALLLVIAVTEANFLVELSFRILIM